MPMIRKYQPSETSPNQPRLLALERVYQIDHGLHDYAYGLGDADFADSLPHADASDAMQAAATFRAIVAAIEQRYPGHGEFAYRHAELAASSEVSHRIHAERRRALGHAVSRRIATVGHKFGK